MVWRGRARERLVVALRAALAVGAIGMTGWMIASVGPTRTIASLERVARWLWVVGAIEGVRIACDGLATWTLFGHRRGRVRSWLVVRATLVANAVLIVAPAGRATAEASKAGMYGGIVGGSTATAAALLGQALAVTAAGVISSAGGVALAARDGASELTLLVVGQSIGMLALGALVLVASRRKIVSRLLGRLLRRVWTMTADEDVRAAVRARAPLPPGPLALHVVARALMAVEIAVLFHGVGATVGLGPVLGATATAMIGAVALDVVPADLGLTEGAFVLWHDAIGLSRVDAVTIAVALHGVQLAWVLAGAVTSVVTRSPRGRDDESRGRESG